MDGRMRVAILGAFFLQVGCDRARGGGTDPVAPDFGLPMLAADPTACKGEPCAEPAAVVSPEHGESVAASAGPDVGCDRARLEAERAMASLSACIRVTKGSGGTSAAVLAIAERVDSCRDDACVAAAEADLAKLSRSVVASLVVVACARSPGPTSASPVPAAPRLDSMDCTTRAMSGGAAPPANISVPR
jgi:hypothetical protein